MPGVLGIPNRGSDRRNVLYRCPNTQRAGVW